MRILVLVLLLQRASADSLIASEIVDLFYPPVREQAASANCPHNGPSLRRWSGASTWPSGSVPRSGQDVVLPAGTKVLIDAPLPGVFGFITVPATSELIFANSAITVDALGFKVLGALRAGSPTCPISSNIVITLHGTRPTGQTQRPDWYKGIYVEGTLDLHGEQPWPAWTRLRVPANRNGRELVLQHEVDWRVGDVVVVVTTALQDSRDWHRNEERTIIATGFQWMPDGGRVSKLTLDRALEYDHYASTAYQAEVGLLSRRIVVQGAAANSPPTDTTPARCEETPAVVRVTDYAPCPNTYLTGYGGHVMASGSQSTARVAGVEFYRMGQTNIIGRYPFHFHMMGAEGGARSYMHGCSVHESYYRCVAVHGTSNTSVSENVLFDVIGHCVYLEDGVEENNKITYNLAALVHFIGSPASDLGQQIAEVTQSANLAIPADIAAAGFYITNTNNEIVGNAASGGWTGFSFPLLDAPIGLHRNVAMKPSARPMLRFEGNSAHSSSFWYQSAGAMYFGGKLYIENDVLIYDAGRQERDTCTKLLEPDKGCRTTDDLWMTLRSTKVYLTMGNGLTHWGKRVEIIKYEASDVGLGLSILGFDWVDQMLVQCRTGLAPQLPCKAGSGCNDWETAGRYWTSRGFEWYDTNQAHILTNITFRRCGVYEHAFVGPAVAPTLRRGCGDGEGKGCSRFSTTWSLLAFSDRHVPEMMQLTRDVKYEDCGRIFRFWNFLTDYGTPMANGLDSPLSARLQNWMDVDGSAARVGKPSILGSATPDANDWWKIDPTCELTEAGAPLYACPLREQRDVASINMIWDQQLAAQLGDTVCSNGDRNVFCGKLGGVRHWGRTGELPITPNGEVTGPSGGFGWHLRWNDGPPRNLIIEHVQVSPSSNLMLSIAYPSGTTFEIKALSPSWCNPCNNPPWCHRSCEHEFSSLSSVQQVRESDGDTYYFDGNILYLRLVQPPWDYTGYPNWVFPENPHPPFSRGGESITKFGWGASLSISAFSCGGNAGVHCTGAVTSAVPAPCPNGFVQTAIDQCCREQNGSPTNSCIGIHGESSLPLQPYTFCDKVDQMDDVREKDQWCNHDLRPQISSECVNSYATVYTGPTMRKLERCFTRGASCLKTDSEESAIWCPRQRDERCAATDQLQDLQAKDPPEWCNSDQVRRASKEECEKTYVTTHTGPNKHGKTFTQRLRCRHVERDNEENACVMRDAHFCIEE
mmetsp:Transcript_20238/g.42749  ORF Transcript_20238/g.42749 Transcript_20238/m.42749 type:complete len:1211 (-) Transcript_20238:513-4145(-)